MRVFKSASAYRVEFRPPITLDAVNDRGAPQQDYVDVMVSAHKSYEARVTRRAPDGISDSMSGGTEAYAIDKKTLGKKLLWHEHPQAQGKLPVGRDLSGDAADEWVEISK